MLSTLLPAISCGGGLICALLVLLKWPFIPCYSHIHLRLGSKGTYGSCVGGSSGVTERLGALGHIDTRGPFTMSPVTLMSV